MNLSARGLALIKSFEGYRGVAYKDANGLWACGYGHTDSVTSATVCTTDQATEWLLEDTSTAQSAVNDQVSSDLTQNQFDALVSFAYNVGVGAFMASTLLRLVNASDWSGAAAQFANWDHIDGVEVAGLERRREAEAQLFQETA